MTRHADTVALAAVIDQAAMWAAQPHDGTDRTEAEIDCGRQILNVIMAARGHEPIETRHVIVAVTSMGYIYVADAGRTYLRRSDAQAVADHHNATTRGASHIYRVRQLHVEEDS